MIKFEYTEVVGWEAAIRGMRNPLESHEKSDSGYCCGDKVCSVMPDCDLACDIPHFVVGPNDLDLMMRLRNAGTDHRKFMRMIVVYVDITAPMYWWKEFDTYKNGVVPPRPEMNSCSTMHTIHKKEFTLEDFSCERLLPYPSEEVFVSVIDALNTARNCYLECQDPITKKDWWYNMIQLLPSSYNQKRTVMLNYEVLANIYKSRKGHKLDEWAEHEQRNIDSTSQALYNRDDSHFGFCDWIKTLPYSKLITGEGEIND